MKGLSLSFPPCGWERGKGVSSSKEISLSAGSLQRAPYPSVLENVQACPEADSVSVSPPSAETPWQGSQNRGDHFPISHQFTVEIFLRKLCKGRHISLEMVCGTAPDLKYCLTLKHQELGKEFVLGHGLVL